jgi:hypothetical protein
VAHTIVFVNNKKNELILTSDSNNSLHQHSVTQLVDNWIPKQVAMGLIVGWCIHNNTSGNDNYFIATKSKIQ